MTAESPTRPDSEPGALQQRLEELEAENVRLRQSVSENRLGAELRAALIHVGTAGTLTAPTAHTDLLDQVVETAANVLRANAAALFLVDEEGRDLVFCPRPGSLARP